jgi:hypothetical protein
VANPELEKIAKIIDFLGQIIIEIQEKLTKFLKNHKTLSRVGSQNM